MDKTTRDMVRQRAGNRCEYCGLRQEHYGTWRHQIEHVVPKKHGGTDEEANLALACMRFNLCKSSNLSGIDSDTGNIEALFNPRSQHWHEHFRLNADRVVGLTPTGRATVSVLNMNDPERLRLRGELLANGELD